ncbi:MAG TPA: hypothetical protein VF067_08625, partial [Sphingomicrobium sp.]
MDRAAEEYVGPINEGRKAEARTGRILLPCQVSYPEIGSASSPGFASRMSHAVDYVIIKQNLIAAGIPASKALVY